MNMKNIDEAFECVGRKNITVDDLPPNIQTLFRRMSTQTDNDFKLHGMDGSCSSVVYPHPTYNSSLSVFVSIYSIFKFLKEKDETYDKQEYILKRK